MGGAGRRGPAPGPWNTFCCVEPRPDALGRTLQASRYPSESESVGVRVRRDATRPIGEDRTPGVEDRKDNPSQRPTSLGRWAWEWIKSIAIAIVLFLVIRTFLVEA